MNYAGILAGGKGTCMGVTERPKQFLRMGTNGTPILIHTLGAFLSCEDISAIVIACPQTWLEYTKVLIAENCTPQEQGRIHAITDGKERFDSLANICRFIEVTFGVNNDGKSP